MRKGKNTSSRLRLGFTLIELLVVILILAVLAALIVPRVIGRTSEAKQAKAQTDLESLSTSLKMFRLDTGRYPMTEEGLDALRTPPSDVMDWKGPYLDKPLPPDPWGFAYVYEWPGPDGDESYYLYSYGSDGAPGGVGEAEDITYGLE